MKKEKKILKTIEVTKQKKKLTSPNGPALSSHAERTRTGPCFLRWRPVVDFPWQLHSQWGYRLFLLLVALVLALRENNRFRLEMKRRREGKER